MIVDSFEDDKDLDVDIVDPVDTTGLLDVFEVVLEKRLLAAIALVLPELFD